MKNKFLSMIAFAIACTMLLTAANVSSSLAGTGIPSITSGDDCYLNQAQNSQVYNLYVAQGGTYHMVLTSVTECSGTSITVNVQSSNTGNWCFEATQTSSGVYEGDFTMPNSTCQTMPISYSCGYPTNCGNQGDYSATGPGGQDQVHFSMAIFDGDCNKITTDEVCNSTCNLGIATTSNCVGNGTCATLSVDGAPDGAIYVWSPGGETTSTIEVCNPGNYSVSVYGSSCQSEASTTLDECPSNCPPIGCEIVADEGNTNTCESSNSYSVNVNGCTGTPSYSWSVDGGAHIDGDADGSSVTIVADHCGPYTVNVHVSCDCGFGDPTETECSFEGTVTGDAPEIHCPSDVEVCDGDEINLGEATADGSSCGGEVNISNDAPESFSVGTTTVIWTASDACGTSTCEQSVTVHPNPSCSLSSSNTPSVGPVCGLSYSVCATTDVGTHFSWSASGDGWSVNNVDDDCTTYTAGPGSGTITVTITTDYGCTSTCDISFMARCEEHCTLTQGAYGNSGGSYCYGGSNVSTTSLITSLLSSGPLTIGKTSGCTGAKYLTIGTGEASCVISKLPANGTPAKLAASSATCSGATGSNWLSGGKFKSVVWGQAITLSLNVRLDPTLGSMVIGGTNLVTYNATSCVNGVATGSPIYTTVPSTYVGQTVNQVLTTANSALAGCTTYTSTQWDNLNKTLNAINVGFDQCKILASWNGQARLTEEAESSSGIGNLSLFPNPAMDVVNISFTAEANQSVSVDVVNMSGQVVSHQIHSTSETNLISLNTNGWAQGVYFVRVNTGSNSEIAKLILVK